MSDRASNAGGRPRTFNREEALDTALDMFWRRGYAATSVAQMCAAMGIHSPSFYAAFGSKQDIYLEVVDRYKALRGPVIWQDLEILPVRKAIASVLRAIAAEYAHDAHPPGCLVVLSSDFGKGEDIVAAVMAKNRAETIDLFRQRLLKAQREDEIPAGLDVDALARTLGSLQQGMAMQARDGASSRELNAMGHLAVKAWHSLVDE